MQRVRPREDTRWWGWGDPAEPAVLPEPALKMLERRGIDTVDTPGRPAIEDVSIPEARKLPESIRRAVGERAVFDDHATRVRHAGGQSLADLIVRRSGKIPAAPDAVVCPEPGALPALLAACSEESVAVIPWGGGTSVTGGLDPSGIEARAVISLDLVGFSGLRVDEQSLTATLGAGLRGPEVEAGLAARGLTLGHFPQSFEYATVGGFAATRSAGQASSGYGRFDEMVTSIEMVTPAGELSSLVSPRTSSGPALREAILGSEGAFGVIPEVTVRIRKRPEYSVYEGWMVPDFDAGSDLVREMAQDGDLPDVIRVSDREETEVSLEHSSPPGIVGRTLTRYLSARGVSGGSLVITGLEGTAEEVRSRRAGMRRRLRSFGAVSLGRTAGEGWRRGRFHGPYLREALLDRGLIVETFETAAIWSRFRETAEAVSARTREEIVRRGFEGLVMCHLSHAYPESGSLYFTVIASPGESDPIDAWRDVKSAALETVVGLGCTLSHHHGVGRDHTDLLVPEVGRLGLDALMALKDAFDPNGVMNPGSLISQRGSGPGRPR